MNDEWYGPHACSMAELHADTMAWVNVMIESQLDA
jgi:hypothetical protein